MKLVYKILIANFVIAVVITSIGLISERGMQRGSDVALGFGIVCLVISIINLFVGFFLLFTKKKEWSSGMLLSGAVLLLLSGISCSQGLTGI